MEFFTKVLSPQSQKKQGFRSPRASTSRSPRASQSPSNRRLTSTSHRQQSVPSSSENQQLPQIHRTTSDSYQLPKVPSFQTQQLLSLSTQQQQPSILQPQNVSQQLQLFQPQQTFQQQIYQTSPKNQQQQTLYQSQQLNQTAPQQSLFSPKQQFQSESLFQSSVTRPPQVPNNNFQSVGLMENNALQEISGMPLDSVRMGSSPRSHSFSSNYPRALENLTVDVSGTNSSPRSGQGQNLMYNMVPAQINTEICECGRLKSPRRMQDISNGYTSLQSPSQHNANPTNANTSIFVQRAESPRSALSPTNTLLFSQKMESPRSALSPASSTRQMGVLSTWVAQGGTLPSNSLINISPKNNTTTQVTTPKFQKEPTSPRNFI